MTLQNGPATRYTLHLSPKDLDGIGQVFRIADTNSIYLIDQYVFLSAPEKKGNIYIFIY